MYDRTYTTPEGFELYKPLVFPDVRDAAELFTFDRPWDHATMGHRHGKLLPGTPEDLRREHPDLRDHKIIGRFLSTRHLDDRRSMAVTPTPLLVDRIWRDESKPGGLEFAFFDHVGFEAIYHKANDRVLIVASASRILASRWVAYVDPASIPTTASFAATTEV